MCLVTVVYFGIHLCVCSFHSAHLFKIFKWLCIVYKCWWNTDLITLISLITSWTHKNNNESSCRYLVIIKISGSWVILKFEQWRHTLEICLCDPMTCRFGPLLLASRSSWISFEHNREKDPNVNNIYICTMDVFHQQSCHYRIRIQWKNIPKEHDADWEKEVHTERNTSNSREKNSTGWSTIQTCHQKWNNTPHNPSSSVTFTLQWSGGCVSASNHQH